jgi:hypothetical protein
MRDRARLNALGTVWDGKIVLQIQYFIAKVVLQSRIGLYLLQLHLYPSFLPHQQPSQLYTESTPAVDTLRHPNPENGNSKSKPKELATNWPEDTLDVCPSSLPTHHPKYHRHRGCPLSFRLIIPNTEQEFPRPATVQSTPLVLGLNFLKNGRKFATALAHLVRSH